MALNLVQRIGEVFVKRTRVIVVNASELFEGKGCILRVSRDCIGYCVTEGKIVDDFAVFLCESCQRQISQQDGLDDIPVFVVKGIDCHN